MGAGKYGPGHNRERWRPENMARAISRGGRWRLLMARAISRDGSRLVYFALHGSFASFRSRLRGTPDAHRSVVKNPHRAAVPGPRFPERTLPAPSSSPVGAMSPQISGDSICVDPAMPTVRPTSTQIPADRFCIDPNGAHRWADVDPDFGCSKFDRP